MPARPGFLEKRFHLIEPQPGKRDVELKPLVRLLDQPDLLHLAVGQKIPLSREGRRRADQERAQ